MIQFIVISNNNLSFCIYLCVFIWQAKQIVQVSEKYEPVSRQPSLSIFSKEVIEPMRNQIKSGIPLLDHREIRRYALNIYKNSFGIVRWFF